MLEIIQLPINVSEITTLGAVSVVAGYLSMGFWLFAQLPQVIENYKNHSVEGVALGFLASWVAGDLSNLIGCLLTKALPFQILLSSYYCSIDLILCSQYLYYTKIYPKLRHRRYVNQRLQRLSDCEDEFEEQEFPQEHISEPIGIAEQAKNASSASIPIGKSQGFGNISALLPTNYSVSNMVTGSFLASFSKVKGYPVTATTAMVSKPNYIVSMIQENTPLIGLAFAWVCTFLYLSARIPQLVKNYQRQSTEGLSVLLFFCALNGNLFYTVSILASDGFSHAASGAARYAFFMKELPYILGSAGTMGFDLVALYQWNKYKQNNYSALGSSSASQYNGQHDHDAHALTTSSENHQTSVAHASHNLDYINNQYSYTETPPKQNTKPHPLLKLANSSSTTLLTHHLALHPNYESEQQPKPINTAYHSLKGFLDPVAAHDSHEKTRLSFDSYENQHHSYGSVFSTDKLPINSAHQLNSAFNTPLTPWDLLEMPSSSSTPRIQNQSAIETDTPFPKEGSFSAETFQKSFLKNPIEQTALT